MDIEHKTFALLSTMCEYLSFISGFFIKSKDIFVKRKKLFAHFY